MERSSLFVMEKLKQEDLFQITIKDPVFLNIFIFPDLIAF